jgi:soluble lytic murein transglycosylase-like protein
MYEINYAADTWKIDPLLIAAIILQESAGKPHALRFEPRWSLYKDPELFAKKNCTTVATEKASQAFSYGLFQVMGCVARERGFQGAYAELYDVRTNIFFGCAQLKFLFDRHKTEIDVISAYNAGTPRRRPDGTFVNQEYVDGVYKYKRQVAQKLKIS